ncbi:MAG: glycine/betaine ABC transporter substrate-binding protein [Alphaproteobacteria bacterium]|nr:glycine/betaine ABC transporter substrate-binding protein [Alphaproteobacteria bacterium]
MGACVRVAASAVALALALGGGAAWAESVPESSDPIKLAMNEWTGQHVTTTIAGKILQRMGYTVEYVTAGYYPQFTGIADGSLTATLELWGTNVGEIYTKALAEGTVEDIGTLGLAPREAWMYPAYVEEMCPGLPNWEALKDCAEIFASPETTPSGRFVDYPADWGDLNNPRIKALGLDFVAIPAGTEGALVAEIQAAVEKKQPILVMFFKPQWLNAIVDLREVELPAYDDACYTDPAWGINPTETYDCDWIKGAAIYKVTWPGMKDKWPAAYNFLKSFQLTNEDQTPLLYAIDQDGRALDEVAEEWVENNKDKWQAWVDAAMM